MKKAGLVTAAVLLAAVAFIHFVLSGAVEDQRNANLPHAPYVVSERARRLHETLFVADLHTDSMLWKRDFLARSDIGHMDVPRLDEGNVALQIFSATTKSPAGQNYDKNETEARDNITLLAVLSFWPTDTWSSIYERAVFQLERLKEYASQSQLEFITNRRELADLVRRREAGERPIGAIYLIEGAHPLEGDIENLDRLFEQGLRIVGLTHFFDNELGGSLHGTSGDGLTDFGRQVIQRADDLEMIIDVAHSSPRMVEDVLSLTSRPVILSHGGVKGVCDTPRNFDDDLMQRITEAGGLIGIGFWDAAVCDDTPEGVARSIVYAVELLGVEHVTLGSDYDGSTAVRFDASELAVLTDALLNAGLSEDQVRAVMGENTKRFLLENLPP